MRRVLKGWRSMHMSGVQPVDRVAEDDNHLDSGQDREDKLGQHDGLVALPPHQQPRVREQAVAGVPRDGVHTALRLSCGCAEEVSVPCQILRRLLIPPAAGTSQLKLVATEKRSRLPAERSARRYAPPPRSVHSRPSTYPLFALPAPGVPDPTQGLQEKGPVQSLRTRHYQCDAGCDAGAISGMPDVVSLR